MPSTPEKSKLSAAQFKRAWRFVTLAGSAGTFWSTICITSAARTKFLTILGATPYHFGIMSALGSLSLAFQLFSGVISNHLHWRKPIWMVTTILHRVSLFGVLATPFFLTENTTFRIVWIIGILFIHDGLAQFGAPFWFSWMADLVPSGTMSRNWGSRQRVVMVVNIVSSLLMAQGFSYFEDSDNHILLGFALIGGFGVLLGVMDIVFFTWVPDVPNERDPESGIIKTIVQPLRDPNFRRYTFYLCFIIFGIQVAAPFMLIFQLEFLKLSTMTVQLILTVNIVGVVIVSRFWGLVCDTYGERPVILVGTLGSAFIPLALFLAPPNFPKTSIAILSIAYFLNGVISGGFAMALQGYLFKLSPRRHRTMYIGSNNFFQGMVMAAASYIGGKYIDLLNASPALHVGIYTLNGYHAIFFLSFILRLAAVYPALRLGKEGSAPVSTFLAHLKSMNPIQAVRTVYSLSESEDQNVRLAACRRLGELHSPLAIRQLIESLEDENYTVRHAAADSLGNIGMAEASEPLARALIDDNLGIQSPAAHALGRIGDFTSLKALLNNLRTLEPEVLSETIDSLVLIGDSAAILPLISLFDEVKDPVQRDKIATALAQLSETSSREVMDLLSMTPPRVTSR